jgi:DNA polymerase III subunit epsilon
VSLATANGSLPGRRTPWRQARWCVIDFELTGLHPRRDQIIAYGAIPVDDGRLRLGGAVSSLVRPTRESEDAAILVHGIRASDLAHAPRLEDALAPLRAVIAGRGLVFHSAGVDRPFLQRALGLRLRAPIVDTEVLGRLWLYEREGRLRRRLSLGELAAALGLPAEQPHDALADALTTAQAFIALASHLDALQAQTVGSLTRAQRGVDSIALFEDHSR